MKHILIAYESFEGQTRKISYRLQENLARLGYHADVRCIRNLGKNTDLYHYEGVIVGAPVHARRYPRSVRKWVKSHARELNRMPTGFFSVCLGILQKDETVVNEENEVVKSLFSQTGWTAERWQIFAGALMFSRYRWLTKLLMRRIAKRAGMTTDPSRDYEFTDWQAVQSFAKNFVQLIQPGTGSMAAN